MSTSGTTDAGTVASMSDEASVPRIAFFAHNRFDSGVIKRINAFRGAGCDLAAFSFRRDGAQSPPPANWADTDLGLVAHRRYGQRFKVYARALRTLWRQRRFILQADVLYARNLDIFLLAWIAFLLTRLFNGVSATRWQPRLVYEAIDVHDTLTSGGTISAMLRWVERRALARCDLLVTSSPGFIRHYFEPRQKYRGPWFLVENKLDHAVLALPRSQRVKTPTDIDRSASLAGQDPRLTIVWPGVIRCQKTLSLLRGVAIAEPDQVSIRIHGRVSHFLIDDFDGQIRDQPNLTFHGAYAWPDGVADVYAGADLVWAQDLEVEGANSDWLLPNRLYEAGYFGVPMIAVKGTETGRYIAAHGLGPVVDDARIETVVAWLRELDRVVLKRWSDALLERDASAFVARPADARALVAACTRRTP